MIIDETLRTSTLVDVEMNHRQEVEIFHDCYAYEENQGQYLEPVQYLPVKKRKEYLRTGEVESNVSQSEIVHNNFAGTQDTMKTELEEEDLNDLLIEPMKTLSQKQVNEMLEEYQAKYGSNYSKPIVTLLPQG